MLAAPITSMTPLFVALLLPIYCGAHRVMLESMLRHCDRNPSCFPRTIQFESLFKLDAATRAREEAVIDEFVRRGYTVTRRTNNEPGHEDVILNKYS